MMNRDQHTPVADARIVWHMELEAARIVYGDVALGKYRHPEAAHIAFLGRRRLTLHK
jgi:hypothetical protein